jgi:phage terminase large subunit
VTTAVRPENPLRDFYARYSRAASPEGAVLFVKEILKAQPDPWQERVLRAYGRRERRIAVRSGHGVGKSTVAAWVVIHHMLTEFPQRTAVTAPTSGQLFDVLFADIKAWIRRLPPALQEVFDIKSDHINHQTRPEDSYITVKTSRPETPEALAGVHSKSVLLIADEASGVHEAIFEAASGSMSGEEACTLLMGNPVRSSGLFYDCFHKLADQWVLEHVSCMDCPRVSKDYIADMKRRYGERSNAFRVRVLGEFPLADDDTVIPYELVASAQQRDIAMPDLRTPCVWGVDVALFGGDCSTLCKRRGNVVPEPVRVWRNFDTMMLTGAIKAEWDATPAPARPVLIVIDALNMGRGVADRLRELGLPVRALNVSESAATKDKFANLRAELWWSAKEWLASLSVQLPKDPELAEQLVKPKYHFRSNGKIQIESKEDMKSRGHESPDVADAFVMTFAKDAAVMAFGGGANALSWDKPLKRNIKGVI